MSGDLKKSLIKQITRVVTSTSLSTMPTIYGVAAAAEVKRLRPASQDPHAQASEVLTPRSVRHGLIFLCFCLMSLQSDMSCIAC